LSVMFLKQLRLHRDSLESRLARQGGASVDQELAQTRQFLTATKDEKWRRQLIKRIKQLEGSKRGSEDAVDLKKRFQMADDMYRYVEKHPEYNKTRRRRRSAVEGG
jgi:hypothetical protein